MNYAEKIKQRQQEQQLQAGYSLDFTKLNKTTSGFSTDTKAISVPSGSQDD